MIIAVSVLLLIAAFLMVVVVLAQNSKGGVADGFSSSTQLIGARKTGDFLSQFTIWLAIAILGFSIAFNFAAKPTDDLDLGNDTEQVDDADAEDIDEEEITTDEDSIN
ncbi:MAG: preprotein translocase subunit SecG [Cytophagaceae bacterium]